MNRDDFWALLESLKGRSVERRVQALTDALATLLPVEIENFADRLAEMLHAIDTPAHARAVHMAATDQFLYVRCAVVLAGRGAYERAVADPQKMRRYRAREAESLLFAPLQAYERATGASWEHETTLSYESGANNAAWGGEPNPPGQDRKQEWLIVAIGCGLNIYLSPEYELTGLLLVDVLNEDAAWKSWWTGAAGPAQLEIHLIFDSIRPENSIVKRGRRLVRVEAIRRPGLHPRATRALTEKADVDQMRRAADDIRSLLELARERLSLSACPPMPAPPSIPTDMLRQQREAHIGLSLRYGSED